MKKVAALLMCLSFTMAGCFHHHGHGHGHDHDKHGEHCPPGQHKKGNC